MSRRISSKSALASFADPPSTAAGDALTKVSRCSTRRRDEGRDGGGGLSPTALVYRAIKMSSHTIHYMPVGNDGNYGVYAPIGPYPPPQWVVPPPQPQPWQVPAPMLPPHLCAPPPTTSGPAPPPAAPQGTESPSRKRKASPAQPRLPASDPRLTREQHLVALRIQLSEDLRYKYDCDGYWTEVTRRYMLVGMPEHKSLDRALPELDGSLKSGWDLDKLRRPQGNARTS